MWKLNNMKNRYVEYKTVKIETLENKKSEEK